MKTKYLILIPTLLTLAACQRMELEDPSSPRGEGGSGWTLTLQATKASDGTKALALDGNRLDAYWTDTETVRVFKGGNFLGFLNVSPGPGAKPIVASLSGSGFGILSVYDRLTLMIPRDNWDYTGQSGTLEAIQTRFDYAVATVSVTSVDAGTGTISTTHASFDNQQSIYRFRFTAGAEPLDPRDFTISAASGKLVQRVSYQDDSWTPAFGPLTVTPAAAPADHSYYVSLRNDLTATDDTYAFIATGADDALYLGTQTVSASVLDAPGKYITADAVTLSKPSFAPESDSPGANPDIY